MGTASPQWKHGRHSAHLPTKLGQRYRAGLVDPNLVNLRSELVLADIRICALLDSLKEPRKGPTPETRETWETIREWLDLRRRLAEAESKREKELLHLIPVNQVHAIVAVFMTEVKAHVTDKKVLGHLSAFWAQLAGTTGNTNHEAH